MLADLIRKNRSCRRFNQTHPVDLEKLKELVNLARLSASSANLQPLCYIISANVQKNEQIFSCLTWAGYLKDWQGPKEGERPSAYIVVLGDTRRARDFGCDHGIAGQSITLGAREMGLAGCMIASVNREKLREILSISDRYKILLVIAVGKPKEQVVIEEVEPEGSIKYWRDDQGIHHVPKRSLSDIIIGSY
ncbi:MAG: nitroreductase family protein [Thermodesulfobacteriota bacterium]